MQDITVIIAFFAGILSFFSPCIFPLIPGYMAFISGVAPSDLSTRRKRVFFASLLFVLGFTLVFSILGLVLNSALQDISYDIQNVLTKVAGVIIVLFGLFMLNLVKLPFLQKDYAVKTYRFKNHYLTSFIFGATFAISWSPCVGAILGSVFALAVSNPSMAFFMLLSYSLGLGLVFILIGVFSDSLFAYLKKFKVFFKYFNLFLGLLLIAFGALVFFNRLYMISFFILL